MSDSQFNTIVQLFAQLSNRVEAVYTELVESQAKMRIEMEAGFAEQAQMKSEMKAGFAEQAKMRVEMETGFAEQAQMKAQIKSGFAKQASMKAQMEAGFTEQTEMKVQMEAGFAEQTALSQSILDIVGEPFQELEQDHQQTKKQFDKRLLKIEKYVFPS